MPIARNMFTFHLVMNIPTIAPINATTEPTERSMLPPVKIHKVIPIARIITYPFWRIKFATFCGFKSVPVVKI